MALNVTSAVTAYSFLSLMKAKDLLWRDDEPEVTLIRIQIA